MANNRVESYKKQIYDTIDYSSFYQNYIELNGKTSGQVSCLCPFHDDKNPSFSVNLGNGLWKCHVGCGGGDIFTMVEKMEKKTWKGNEVLNRVGELVGLPPLKSTSKNLNSPNKEKPNTFVTQTNADLWHKALMDDYGEILNWLEKEKGLIVETVIEFKLGIGKVDLWKIHRITIPVHDENKKLVNVRGYGNSLKPKILPIETGRGSQIFNIHRVKDKQDIIICAGEFDCMLVWQKGFNAVSSTAGESSCKVFKENLNYFRQKNISIIYDIDEAGRSGAAKVGDILSPVAQSVKIVQLPDILGKGGDLSDFFISGNTADKN